LGIWLAMQQRIVKEFYFGLLLVNPYLCPSIIGQEARRFFLLQINLQNRTDINYKNLGPKALPGFIPADSVYL
jgi:hypothetical protein